VNAAKSILPGAPEHAFACELARLRGYDPNAMIVSVEGLPQVANWQWLIAEQILEAGLRHTLGQGAGAQKLMAH
jgi:hypothetical protein